MSIIYQRFLPAVGKSHGVRSLDVAGTIGSLLGVEVGLGVVISHGVGEGVGGNLIRVSLSLVSGGWGIGGGGLDNNGGVDSVSHNWGSVDSMGNWGMGNHMGWANVWGKVTSMSDNTSVADGGMVSNIRGRGSGSKAEEGGNDESLEKMRNLNFDQDHN